MRLVQVPSRPAVCINLKSENSPQPEKQNLDTSAEIASVEMTNCDNELSMKPSMISLKML